MTCGLSALHPSVIIQSSFAHEKDLRPVGVDLRVERQTGTHHQTKIYKLAHISPLFAIARRPRKQVFLEHLKQNERGKKWNLERQVPLHKALAYVKLGDARWAVEPNNP